MVRWRWTWLEGCMSTLRLNAGFRSLLMVSKWYNGLVHSVHDFLSCYSRFTRRASGAAIAHCFEICLYGIG